MKTKMLIQTTGLTIIMILLTTFISNAQIHIQGLGVDNEGIAVWNANGSGPEPTGFGHVVPWLGSVGYYTASRDYDGIDPHPDAALCHFLDSITGFPLFVQALTNIGFTPDQVKVKTSLFILKDDIEGEDWFTIDTEHYYNRYNGYYFIELNGESMISGYTNYIFSYLSSAGNPSGFKTSFSMPVNASSNSSDEVKAVAAAFLADMVGQELRFVITDKVITGVFDGNGRYGGVYVDIVAGFLEKGLPELPITGLAADHEGLACWNADGTGPEPEATGHTFWYGGTQYWTTYYIASRDYDDIDPDPNACIGHFIGDLIDFPNLNVQLNYLGYTLDQLTAKTDIATMGNDIEDEDWGVEGNIHWYHTYGNKATIEIAGEPILECIIDTNYNYWYLDDPGSNWSSNTNYVTLSDISANTSSNAQHVAASFLKDLNGHSIKFVSEGNDVSGSIDTCGRNGVFQEILSATLVSKLPAGTHIWDNEVSGTWDLEGSPYVVMGPLNVPDGETLIIEPGVVVKFNTTEMFMIDGCIIAEGTEEDPILFTAFDNSVRWGGMGWDQTPVTNGTSILKHCIFEYAYAYDPENISGYNSGGAIGVNDYENIEISYCLFRYNLADKPGVSNPAGGAIILYESSIPVSHCIFHDNQAGHGGAIALSSNSNPVIDNCLFYNNEALNYYGGVFVTINNCSPQFINCTFANNYAIHGGGVAELQSGGTTTFWNSILWGNSAGNGYNQISSLDPYNCALNIYYSDVEGGTNGINPGIQLEYLYNLELDPDFMDVGEFPFALRETSPCVDAGWPADWYMIANLDIIGNERVFDGNEDGSREIDMGAYEFVASSSSLILGDNSGMKILEKDLQIFPNPFRDEMKANFTLDDRGYVTIDLYDLMGKKIAGLYANSLSAGDHELTFSGHYLAEGIYICRLQTENKMTSRKIIKMR